MSDLPGIWGKGVPASVYRRGDRSCGFAIEIYENIWFFEVTVEELTRRVN
jgi:hypothetical protein